MNKIYNKAFYAFILIIFLGPLSCIKPTGTSKKKANEIEENVSTGSTNENNNNNTTPPPTVPQVADCSDKIGLGATSNVPYFTIGPITKKGQFKNPFEINASTENSWFSHQDPSVTSGMFSTDNVLQLRIKVLPSPPGSGQGNFCVRHLPYTKLKATIGIRAEGQTTYSETLELTAGVNQCSDVVSISNIPTQGNIVIDIFNAISNHFCIESGAQNCQNVFDTSFISHIGCWKIELHVATVFTKLLKTL